MISYSESMFTQRLSLYSSNNCSESSPGSVKWRQTDLFNRTITLFNNYRYSGFWFQFIVEMVSNRMLGNTVELPKFEHFAIADIRKFLDFGKDTLSNVCPRSFIWKNFLSQKKTYYSYSTANWVIKIWTKGLNSKAIYASSMNLWYK